MSTIIDISFLMQLTDSPIVSYNYFGTINITIISIEKFNHCIVMYNIQYADIVVLKLRNRCASSRMNFGPDVIIQSMWQAFQAAELCTSRAVMSDQCMHFIQEANSCKCTNL